MIERVRRAASASMPARSRTAGGTISRSLSAFSQRVWTPIDSSTSMSRLTSSIRATLRNVVVPRLSSDAHSSATPAFLLVLTSISPDSSVPPATRRWLGPDVPRVTISESRASPIRASISRLRFCPPFSIRLTALWLVPSSVASWVCVQPRCLRASRIRPPIRTR